MRKSDTQKKRTSQVASRVLRRSASSDAISGGHVVQPRCPSQVIALAGRSLLHGVKICMEGKWAWGGFGCTPMVVMGAQAREQR